MGRQAPVRHRRGAIAQPREVSVGDAGTTHPRRADVFRLRGDGVAWFRGHLPYFAEVATPLYDLYARTKTSNNAKKHKLSDLAGWQSEAFKAIKELTALVIKTAYFDPTKQTCVFTDTSDALVITQCEPGAEILSWDEQVVKHRPLINDSGRFRHSQLRWSVVEKEVFIIAVKDTHWINGGQLPVKFFTDHLSLLSIFDDKTQQLSCSRTNPDKMTRWSLEI